MKKYSTPVGGSYDEHHMKSLVKPPVKPPFYLRIFANITDAKAKKKMLMGRVLSWSPLIAIVSGLLELFIEKGAALCLEKRMRAIVRIIISYTIPSMFALDINLFDYQKYNITSEELEGLRGVKRIDIIKSFSEKEKTALRYVQALSKTPIVLNNAILNGVRQYFSETETVAIAALCAKVNYWARLFEAMRIKPAGYTDDPALHLDEYKTLDT